MSGKAERTAVTRGISPIVVALALVGLTLALGATVYRVTMKQVRSLTAIPYLRADIDLISTGSACAAVANVQNTGTVRLENLTVTIRDDDNRSVVICIGSLAPGQQKGAENSEGRWTPNRTYIAVISAQTAEGGSLVRAVPVAAHG
jgi:hypothetical protein